MIEKQIGLFSCFRMQPRIITVYETGSTAAVKN